MTNKQQTIDVFECFFYHQYGEKGLQMCKYYPDFCNKCLESIKVGTMRDGEEKNA